MRVNEIFHSVQGEGIYNQIPMVFIRLQGCNLYPNGCLYCDTQKAQKPNDGIEMSVNEIMRKAHSVRHGNMCWWYCITGGEPLMQEPELHRLVNGIKGGRDTGDNKIEVETNGTLPPPRWFSRVDSWVLDIKTPSAGQHVVNQGMVLEAWRDKLRRVDQVKFVVETSDDLDFVRSVLYARHFSSTVLISPVVHNRFDSGEWFSGSEFTYDYKFIQEVLNFVLKNNLRLSVQIHKFLGVS